MKKGWIQIVSLLLVALLLTGCMPAPSSSGPTGDSDGLSQTQRNTIAMLNYLALTTEQIHSLPNSQAMLEGTYSLLLSEFNLNAVDAEAKAYLDNIQETIRSLLSIEAKRERLQYVYNQEKGAAIYNALPNPLTMASLTESFGSPKFAISATLTVIEVATKYASAIQGAQNNYDLGNWDLSEEQRDKIFASRGDLFDYMWQVVHQYESEEEQEKLSKLILSEAEIKQFVSICKTDSPQSRLEQLKDKEEVYAFFGNYWLELASCYFEVENYAQCLECIATYQNLGITIFKRDFNLVPLLPKAIVAAQNVYASNPQEYMAQTKTFAGAILTNTTDDDWSERYFAATTYLDLYTKTEDALYLETAFEIIKDNVAHLAETQKEINNAYLADVDLIKNPSDDDKAWADSYNSQLQADELGIRDSEKDNLQNILHGGSQIFLCDFVNNQYSYNPTSKLYQGSFSTTEFMLPSSMLHQGSVVTVTVGDRTYTDVNVTRVERSGNDINNFKVYFTSEELKNQTWALNVEVKIEIDNGYECDVAPIYFRVTTYHDYLIFGKTVEFTQFYP